MIRGLLLTCFLGVAMVAPTTAHALRAPTKQRRMRRPPKPPPAPYIPPQAPDRGRLEARALLGLAQEYEDRIKGIVTQLQTLVAEAKQKEDSVRLNCLLDKLFQVQNHKVTANSALGRFQLAVAENDNDQGYQHFNELASTHQSALHYEDAAGTCATTLDFRPNNAEVNKSVIPDDKLPPPFPADSQIPERPPNATPYI